MPEQSKFENVDLFASLEAIMKQNTGFYQSDLDIDKEIIIAQRRGFCYPYPRSVPFSRSGCLSACKMLSMFCLIISYSRTFFFSFP